RTAPVVRVLRGGVHATARHVQSGGAGRRGGVPRHRKADLPPRAGDDERRSGSIRQAKGMTINCHERGRGRSGTRLVIVLWGAIALAGGRAAAAQTAAHAAPPRTPLARVLVVPFENVNREGRLFWMQDAAAVLLADDLNAMGVDAITREQRRQA